jgi:DNA-binding GntR family transcriptional regulator
MADSTAEVGQAHGAAVVVPPVDNTAHAYERVRTAILTGELPPGTSLSQVQLAAKLDVSRTPLREALRLLQNEGLIESDFNRRVRVSSIGIADLEDLYAMRIALEPLAVRLTVPELDDADIAAMDACLGVMDDALGSRVFSNSIEPHRAFHFHLISRMDTRMRRPIENMWDHAERYRQLYQESAEDRLALLQLAMKEHYGIFAAARDRDATLCSRLVAEHMARTALTVIAEVDKAHDPTRVREALRYVVDAAL